MNPDVIVVGGGVIGTAIGFQLAKAGARVVVLERGAVGAESTGASAGMVMPRGGPDSPPPLALLSQESARLFPALAEELKERTGVDIGLRPAPVLDVAFNETEEHELRRQRPVPAGYETAARWLDPATAIDVEPALNPAIRGALYYTGDQQLLPRPFAQAMAYAAGALGATIREGVAVDRLLLEGDRVAGVAFGNESIRADEIVLATGSWSASWAKPLDVAIPVRPIRGQMLSLQSFGPGLRAVISDAGGHLLSKPDGRIIAGTTVEDVGFDARPTVEGVMGILARVMRLAPRLSGAAVTASWAGLRPGTADELPMIGRIGQWRGVTLATGHYRNGILLAPITAELVTDLLLRRKPRVEVDAFDPGRFMVRAA